VEEFLVGSIYILIFFFPLAGYILIKNKLLAYIVSSVFGVLIINGRMIYLEQHAVDSDFDGIFLIGMVVWSAVIWIAYLLLFLLFNLVMHLRNKISVKPNH
jgi:hypothetical protein